MKKLSLTCFFWCILLHLGFTQTWFDNFSDGDLQLNPTWTGDVTNFVISPEQQLRLFAPDAGNSVLFSATPIPDSAIWTGYVKLDFDPSAGNQMRYYLQANQTDVLSSSGYYLRIGEDGSSDALKLYRQDAGTATLLISGTAAALATQPAEVIFEVVRTLNGEWKLSADYLDGAGPQLQGTATDITHPGNTAIGLGLYCVYTATRKDKFYFDDLSLSGFTPPDLVAPSLLSANGTWPNVLLLNFSEPILGSSLANAVLSINGNPQSDFVLSSPNQITVQASPNFVLGANALVISGATDLSGNLLPSSSLNFDAYPLGIVLPKDIIINELFADPTPSLGLPAYEYIEIYNKAAYAVDVSGLSIATGATPQFLPSYILAPGAYVVLCDDAAVADFLALVPNVVGLASFPALTNGGDTVILRSNEVIIDAVTYSLATYNDNNKAEGGWSLERISAQKACAGTENWTASTDLSGGTPGVINAVFENSLDETGPTLLSVFPESETRLIVSFDESLLPQTSNTLFSLSPAVDIVAVQVANSLSTVWQLDLATPLALGTAYTLTATNQLLDCLANAKELAQTYVFALPENAMAGDIVINEFLADPATGGSRFVEVYNRSNKILSLQGMVLGAVRDFSTDVSVIEQQALIFPNAYAVFADVPEELLSRFEVPFPNALFALNLPTLDSDSDNLTLYAPQANGEIVVLDSFTYFENWQNGLYNTTSGVSLERLSDSNPSGSESNWQNASSLAGYATPTGPNSQSSLAIYGEGTALVLLPDPVFSPDNDGNRDQLLVKLLPEQSMGVASIRIYDMIGHFIYDLANRSALSSYNVWQWDGQTAEGQRARIGIYLLVVEIAYPDGQTVKETITCTLGGKG